MKPKNTEQDHCSNLYSHPVQRNDSYCQKQERLELYVHNRKREHEDMSHHQKESNWQVRSGSYQEKE